MSTPGTPQNEAQFFTTIRSWDIVRGDNRLLGGVVEGVGNRIGLARVPARLIALLLIPLTGGLIISAYAAAWAILPDSSGRIVIQDFGRGTPNVPALIGIGILALIGFNSLAWTGPLGLGWFGVLITSLIGLAIVVGVVVLIAWAVTKDHDGNARLTVEFRANEAAKASAAAAKDAARTAGLSAKEAAREAGRSAREAARAVRDEAKSAGKTIADESKNVAKKTKAAAAEIRDAVAVQATASKDSSYSPPPVPVPPAPLRPRVPGPGKAIRLFALAMAFLSGAIVWWLNREDLISRNPFEVWAAVMVVVVGIAIILAGAAGRRIGPFGFWATVLVIGWSIRIVAGPEVDRWFETHDVFWDWEGEPRLASVEDGTLECRGYDNGITTSTTIVAGERTTLTVTDSSTTIIVPDRASVVFDSPQGPVTATVSWEGTDRSGTTTRYATCDVDADSARFHTIGHKGDSIEVSVAVPNATIVIKER